MKEREALKLALEALEEIALAGMSPAPEMIDSKEAFHARQAWRFIGVAARALEPIKEALAQPGQKPVGEVISGDKYALGQQTISVDAPLEIGTALYTTPPQRTWVGLTDEETDFIIRQPHGGADPQEWARNLASALEAKLKEKNT